MPIKSVVPELLREPSQEWSGGGWRAASIFLPRSEARPIRIPYNRSRANSARRELWPADCTTASGILTCVQRQRERLLASANQREFVSRRCGFGDHATHVARRRVVHRTGGTISEQIADGCERLPHRAAKICDWSTGRVLGAGNKLVASTHYLFLSVENSYSPSFRNCELVLLNGLHHSSKKSNPFADHPTYRNRHLMVNSFSHGAEGFAVGNVELAHWRSPIGGLSWRPRSDPGAGFCDKVLPICTSSGPGRE